MAMLLMAGTIQAAHICGLSLGNSQAVLHTSEDISSSSAAICPFCLIAHATTMMLLFVATFSPAARRTFATISLQPGFSLSLKFGRLFVRPPPTY